MFPLFIAVMIVFTFVSVVSSLWFIWLKLRIKIKESNDVLKIIEIKNNIRYQAVAINIGIILLGFIISYLFILKGEAISDALIVLIVSCLFSLACYLYFQKLIFRKIKKDL